MRIGVVKDWDWPDLRRQTPGEDGIWDNLEFTFNDIEECDFAIILNKTPATTNLFCPSGRVWAIMQEPPIELHRLIHRGDRHFSRIYTTDVELHGRRYFHSQPALPWHVNKTFSELVKIPHGDKEKNLSWITSRTSRLEGHKHRLNFLDRLERSGIAFDLYGKHDRFIGDKFDGLYPYKYSVVFENFRNPLYWSEKLADCYLSWTMPIYYGCTRIFDFFPPESMIQIDIDDPEVFDKIREAVASDRWLRHQDAIAYAREKILNEYQFFPMMHKEISEYLEDTHHREEKKSQIRLSEYPLTAWVLRNWYRKYELKIRRRLHRILSSKQSSDTKYP